PHYDLISQLRAFFAETRPDPLERTFAAIRQPAWRQAVADLAFRFPRDVEASLRTAGQAGNRWRVMVSHPSRRQRAVATESGWSTGLLLALAGVILLTAAPLPWPAQATLAGPWGGFAFATR